MIYCDLLIDGVAIWHGVPCLNHVFINGYSYLNFSGDLFFHDTEGNTDPTYLTLGVRYILFYIPADAPPAVIVPLAAIPSQSFSIVLAGQNCEFSFYEKERL